MANNQRQNSEHIQKVPSVEEVRHLIKGSGRSNFTKLNKKTRGGRDFLENESILL